MAIGFQKPSSHLFVVLVLFCFLFFFIIFVVCTDFFIFSTFLFFSISVSSFQYRSRALLHNLIITDKRSTPQVFSLAVTHSFALSTLFSSLHFELRPHASNQNNKFFCVCYLLHISLPRPAPLVPTIPLWQLSHQAQDR